MVSQKQPFIRCANHKSVFASRMRRNLKVTLSASYSERTMQSVLKERENNVRVLNGATNIAELKVPCSLSLSLFPPPLFPLSHPILPPIRELAIEVLRERTL
jgi:hypothetical protein